MKQLLLYILFFSVGTKLFSQYNNIEFVENKGQWDERVQYRGQITHGAFFIRNGGFTVVKNDPEDAALLTQFLHGVKADGGHVGPNDKFVLHSHAWHVDFLGASSKIEAVADKALPTHNNYFIGNDPKKWATDCKLFQAVTLKDVYPNIDVRYYTDKEFLKYDIIVRPGGDISKIALKYDGVDKIEVKNKELAVRTSVGEMKESSPFTYQATGKGREEVGCKYIVKDNVVRFEVKEYDPTQTLIIDPIIIFGSFTGSTADNYGFTATYGPDGSMYGGAMVFGGGGSFPTTPGAFQTSFQGGSGSGGPGTDIGIIKLSSNGSNRIYATYVGGSGNDQAHSLIVDPQGNLILVGRSNSANYPMNNGGQIGSSGGYDIVITKLNATGSAIIGSRKIGGSGDDGVNIQTNRIPISLQQNYGDDGRSEVMLDNAGNIYVAAMTLSTNFPATAGAFQTTSGGQQDGVVIKFNSTLSNLNFASYFGGSKHDAAYVISLKPGTEEIYIAGGTESGNLPGNKTGVIGGSNFGNIDGFVSVIANNGSSIIKTTYIGTTGIDQVFGIKFDKSGFPYIMGQTTGNWQVVNAAYSNSGGKQFIAKLKPDLSSYVYSTCFGSGAATPNISPIAFLVDRCENVYISGWGGFIGPTNGWGTAGTSGLPVTPDAFKATTDGKDLYFFVLKKDAASQLFGSFYGENNTNGGCDHVDGGTSRFDAEGNIYQAICGNCNIGGVKPNPLGTLVTNGAWSTTNNSPGCDLTMIKIAMQLAGVNGGIRSSINGVPRDTLGCIPLTVDFTDTIGIAQSYEWYFNYTQPGGGPPDLVTTTASASFTYNSIGTYTVMLVAIDPNTCNVRDTSYLTIVAGDKRADLAMNYTKLTPCQSFNYEFTNLSNAPQGPAFTATSFIWDFGDGSPLVTTPGFAPTPLTHTYAGPGTYNVKLKIIDSRYCNGPDSIIQPISVESLVKASFTTPAVGCLPYNAVFKNTSTGGQTWLWEFGDATTSTAFEPVHLYANPGVYNVRLIASNPNTCNGIDTSAYFTITVFPSPGVDFSFSPLVPINNTPTTFINNSPPEAVKFKWTFGDGDSLITTSRAPVVHQYNSTGTFNACLTAYNQVGCDSTICKEVKTNITALVDVPNAFTPNSGDGNSTIGVKGFAIAKMQFIIWNRWGQKVFETSDRNQGWDGKVKGVLQPMDVYAYTLQVEFNDGTKTTKKGDITLIR